MWPEYFNINKDIYRKKDRIIQQHKFNFFSVFLPMPIHLYTYMRNDLFTCRKWSLLFLYMKIMLWSPNFPAICLLCIVKKYFCWEHALIEYVLLQILGDHKMFICQRMSKTKRNQSTDILSLFRPISLSNISFFP